MQTTTLTVGTFNKDWFVMMTRLETDSNKPTLDEMVRASIKMRMYACNCGLRNENWAVELCLEEDATEPNIHCSKHRTTVDLPGFERWEVLLL